jgi:flagellar biosynthesis component FlhA
MRKLVAIAAALGFLATTSLTPVMASPAIGGGMGTVKSDDLSAAKKKAKKKKAKKAKKAKKKMSSVMTEDLSSAKKKAKKKAKKSKKKAAKKKMSSVIEYRIAG